MDKLWFSSYTPGVPHTIDPDVYHSLIHLFDERAEKYAHATAFISFGVTLTYEALRQRSVTFAAYLQSTGLKKGDRVAIMLPNCLQYVVAMMGILRAGMTVVNVNPMYTPPELVRQINDAGAALIIVLSNFAHTVQQALPQLVSTKKIMITELGDLLGFFKGRAINFVVKYLKKAVPKYTIPDMISFSVALCQGASLSFVPVSVSHEDIAFLQYTGGTTGIPKAAMLTHRNMVANVLQCATWVSSVLSERDLVIAALPMYHIFSLTVCCLAFISLGAKSLLITDPRDIRFFIRILRRIKVNVFVGLNTLFNALMEQSQFEHIDFSALKLTVSGGMAMQRVVAERWYKATGCQVTEGYGLTEASPVVTINPLPNTHFSGSIGLPVPSTDVMICDDAGQAVACDAIGELCVKGPQVMRGYWKKPEETALIMNETGWLRTGDLARMDARGFIYIVDRKKDMILVSGFNVYPNEVEDVIAACPGVREVAVIGVPSEKTGEAIKAFVVRADAAVTEEEIKRYCAQYLTRYKLPKFIEFCDALPKSNVGKVLRRKLKEHT